MSRHSPELVAPSLDGADERRFLLFWLDCTRERTLPTQLCRKLRRNYERQVTRGLPVRSRQDRPPADPSGRGNCDDPADPS